MLEEVYLEDCIGKVVQYVNIEDKYGIFTFTDGTFSILRASAPYADCPEMVNEPHDPEMGDFYLAAAGIATYYELAAAAEERKLAQDKKARDFLEERDLREYNRLKAKFGNTIP
jgi:hypothetical protein